MKHEEIVRQYFLKRCELAKVSKVGQIVSINQTSGDSWLVTTTCNGSSVTTSDMAQIKVDMNLETQMKEFLKERLQENLRITDDTKRAYIQAQNQVQEKIRKNEAKMNATMRQNVSLESMSSTLHTLDIVDAQRTYQENLFELDECQRSLDGLHSSMCMNAETLKVQLRRLEFCKNRLKALNKASFEVISITKRNQEKVDFLVFEIRFIM